MDFRLRISEAAETLMPMALANAVGPLNSSNTSSTVSMTRLYTHHVHGVNMINVYTFCDYPCMASMGDRLKEARQRKFPADSARAVAKKFGWPYSTYAAHENGQNEFDPEDAAKYGKRFGVAPGWLLTGDGPREPVKDITRPQPSVARLVGYVGAGAQAQYLPAGDLGEVPAPAGATDKTVAVEIRGDSLGPLFDHWLVFYDDVRNPVTADLHGQLCVVGLEDGRILIKKVRPSRTKGHFHLISQTEDPILDARVEWAAKVKHMVPR